MSDTDLIQCPHCGQMNALPEGRAGVPVCGFCNKALVLEETFLPEISEEEALEDVRAKAPPAVDFQALKGRILEVLTDVWSGLSNRDKGLAVGGLVLAVTILVLLQSLFGFPEAPRKACAGGDMEACLALGHLYERDETLQDRLEEALALYRQACEGGSDAACRTLYRFLRDYPEVSLTCAETESRCRAVRARVNPQT